MDYNKLIIVLAVILIVIAVGCLMMFNQTAKKTTTNTANVTNTTNTTNATNINLTNNATDSTESKQNQNNYDSEYTQGKVNSKDVPSDIYSRWDTDGDGKFSSAYFFGYDDSILLL